MLKIMVQNIAELKGKKVDVNGAPKPPKRMAIIVLYGTTFLLWL